MDKSVLISIQPKWCDLIAAGKKTIEVRKTRPKLKTPFKCYIYCTQSGKYSGGKAVKNIWINRGTKSRFIGNGKIIGEFICDEIKTYLPDDFVGAEVNGTIRENPIDGEYGYWIPDQKQTCLTYCEILKYGDGKTLYGWHISNLVLYDRPKDLSDFQITCDNKFDELLCSKCNHCKDGKCNRKIRKAPQSWCYVEEEVTGDETNL